MIIAEPKDFIAGWAAAKTGLPLRPPYGTLAATDPEGRIVAALIFTNHHLRRDIEITVAAASIPRALLRAGYRYAVGQLGCRRASFKLRADNEQAISALERLNALCEGRIRKFYPDGCDQLLFGILKEDYPYGV